MMIVYTTTVPTSIHTHLIISSSCRWIRVYWYRFSFFLCFSKQWPVCLS